MNDEQRPRSRGPGNPGAGLRALASALGRRSAVVVRFEQAVYGSFPFRDQGYALLAQSPGCRPGWLADFRTACQNLGERPAGVPDAGGLFALRLPSGPWAVVGVSPQGCDDRGRPGALAFHGLFLAPREYRRAGCDPFALAGALETHWSEQTLNLPAGSHAVEPLDGTGPADPRVPRIASALAKGRRVALEAPGPIDALARQVWRALPGRVRARASVATWAFGNGNRFDLLAVPRLAGVALDETYLDPDANEAATPVVRRSPRLRIAAAVVAILTGAVVGLALRGSGTTGIDTPSPVAPMPSASVPVSTPPPRGGFGGADDAGPDERRRAAEALEALADRFGLPAGGEAPPDPPALMERIARGLRYGGPFLPDADRERLGRDPGRDAALALRWDAHARRFADDRPLPEDFRLGPLRWQLDVLVWSFHGEADVPAPGRSAEEVVQALGEWLSVDLPLQPTALSERDPALRSYLTFLGRLPRR